MIIGRDPEDETISVLANHKNNPIKKVASLSYQITSDDEQGDPRSYVRWLGVNKHSSQQLFEPSRVPQGANRLQIFKIMEEADCWMYIEDVWKIMAAEDEEIESENVKKTMQRMEKSGQIKKGPSRGKYAVPSVPSVPLPDEATPEAASGKGTD